MKYRIKYQTRGKVESYIAAATPYIVALTQLFEEWELDSVLDGIGGHVLELAEEMKKGATAVPKYEVENRHLHVYNTNGREVLLVWFERVYDKERQPAGVKF